MAFTATRCPLPDAEALHRAAQFVDHPHGLVAQHPVLQLAEPTLDGVAVGSTHHRHRRPDDGIVRPRHRNGSFHYGHIMQTTHHQCLHRLRHITPPYVLKRDGARHGPLPPSSCYWTQRLSAGRKAAGRTANNVPSGYAEQETQAPQGLWREEDGQVPGVRHPILQRWSPAAFDFRTADVTGGRPDPGDRACRAQGERGPDGARAARLAEPRSGQDRRRISKASKPTPANSSV